MTPPDLVARRTREAFAERLSGFADRLRVAGAEGAPLGLCIVADDHRDQLYVALEARGSGLAAALLQDGEDRLRTAGIEEAGLDCALLNRRAARFHEREG
jgi:GNAT superfamily N-acetyltransferase